MELLFHPSLKVPDELDSFCLQLAAGGEFDFARRYPLTAVEAGTPRSLTVIPGDRQSDTFEVLVRGEHHALPVWWQRRQEAFQPRKTIEAHFWIPDCTVASATGRFEDRGLLTTVPAAVASTEVAFAPSQVVAVMPGKVERFAWLPKDGAHRILLKEDGLPPAPGEAASRVLTADVDGDCDLDLIVLVPSGPRIWRQENGVYAELPDLLPAGAYLDGAAGDLDGDGNVDLVLVSKEAVRIFLGEGQTTGRFVDASSGISGLTGGATDVALGFITRGAVPDIVLARGPDAAKLVGLLQAEPGGKWRYLELSGVTASTTRSVAVADMNGDGFPDVVIGNVKASSTVLLNDPLVPGTPGNRPDLVRTVPGSDKDEVQDLAVGDIDGDCHTDLVLVRKTAVRVLINDGQGFLAEPAEPYPAGVPTHVSIVDLDGDGYLDLVVAGGPGGTFWMRQQDRL